LLIHGTTQSPEGWGLLVEELKALGHSAVTTDLALFGDALSVTGYADAVAAELSEESVDVAVAHSGAGLLLPAMASAVNAKLQAYLAAFIPDRSRSLIDELDDDAAAMFHEDWIGVDPTADPSTARHFLFHDCKPDVAAWAMTTLRLFIPRSVYSAQVPLAPAIPAVVVVPDKDRTLRTEWMVEASRERLGVEPTIIGGGHCPHVSQPRRVATILESVLAAQ
jgi:pimeloyl-ACP methyl ester carboxylesterase